MADLENIRQTHETWCLIVMRIREKQVSFHDEQDYTEFLRALISAHRAREYPILAYSLLPDHAYLLVHAGKQEARSLCLEIWEKYRHFYQQKYSTRARDMDRYLSITGYKRIEDVAGSITHIWRAPLEEGLCARLDDYPWSSYRLIRSGTLLIDYEELEAIMCRSNWQLFAEQGQMPLRLYGCKGKPRDAEATEILLKVSGITRIREIPALPQPLLGTVCDKAYGKGVSIFQMSRILGISRYKINKAMIHAHACSPQITS